MPSTKRNRGQDRLKRRKGPNAETRTKTRQPHYVINAIDLRTHEVIAGDLFTCAHCGISVVNIAQHQTTECDNSQHYTFLMDKFREGFLYLVQRNVDHSKIFESPGKMRMLSPSIVVALMQKVSFERLLKQDARWNVLMPVMVEDMVGGARVASRSIFEYYNEIVQERGGQKVSDFVTSLEDEGQIVTEWNHNHQPRRSLLQWTKEEQNVMEKTRDRLANMKVHQVTAAAAAGPVPSLLSSLCTGSAANNSPKMAHLHPKNG